MASYESELNDVRNAIMDYVNNAGPSTVAVIEHDICVRNGFPERALNLSLGNLLKQGILRQRGGYIELVGI